MGEHQIERLPELLSGYLGPNREIVETKITALTAPGENFGSVMLKLDVKLRNRNDGKEDVLYAVAKKIPENEMFQEAFNIQVTYRNEVNWYTKVVPILIDFQKSLGIKTVISSFPEIYGARFNLNNSTNIDKDAVFVLENVQVSGFRNIDRVVGFDLDTAKLVLRSMAELHAVPLALKLKQPDVFEEKVKIHRHNFKFRGMGDEFDKAILEILLENERCKPLVSKFRFVKQRDSVAREPFATMTHNDLWTNNTMQKFEDGKAIANKFVDFQVVNYSSPAGDLFFFLFSSVQLEVLRSHLDDLIKYYHEQFTKILKEHQCDVSPFTFDAFLEELRLEGKFELFHSIMFTFFVVNGRRGETDKHPTVETLVRSASQKAKEKAWYILETCVPRGWC